MTDLKRCVLNDETKTSVLHRTCKDDLLVRTINVVSDERCFSNIMKNRFSVFICFFFLVLYFQSGNERALAMMRQITQNLKKAERAKQEMVKYML